MSKTTRTIQVHTNNPVSADLTHDHLYHKVAKVDMEYGLTLYGEDQRIIAAYQEHAWASWNVVPEAPTSSGEELRITSHMRAISDEEFATHLEKQRKRVEAFSFADRRNTPPRDAKGRFVKRKDTE